MKKVNHLPHASQQLWGSMITAALQPHAPSKEVTDMSQKRAVETQSLGFSPWLVTGHHRTRMFTWPLWAPHFAYPPKCTRGPGLLSLFCKWFLPCSPHFPPQLGPSTVLPSPHHALCDAVLLPHLTSFSLMSFFCHSHTLCKLGCPQLCHMCSLTAKAPDAL